MSLEEAHVSSFLNLSFSMQIKSYVGPYLVLKENFLKKMSDFSSYIDIFHSV